MWEAIRANRRRSNLLIGLMGAILVGLGAVIGATWGGAELATVGAFAALLVWLVMLATALLGGERVLLATARARPIKKEDAPRLWNVVEEMTIASGLGTPPKIYVIDDDIPNAFAAGRKPENAVVAVTSGLLKRLNRDELQGVIAHEIAHIRNLDVRFMTIAGVMVGSVAILSDIFLRSLFYGGGKRRGKGGGQAQIVLILVAVVVAILAPICTQMLYYACSRRREYLADASAARFTRYPPGLASALEKISGGVRRQKGASGVLAPMYIVNPLQAVGRSGLFSTHPPTAKRIDILRSMGGNAGWMDYEAAYNKVTGKSGCLDAATLGSEGSIAARGATPAPELRQDSVAGAREVGDFLDRMADFLFIACVCGVRIKVPEDLDRSKVPCPRCGREHDVPRAEAVAAVAAVGEVVKGGVDAATQGKEAAAAATGAVPGAGQVLRYRRKGDGWESFKCSCGHALQISPAFRGNAMSCRRCRRKVEIVA
jgi:heat shock protein HtpX